MCAHKEAILVNCTNMHSHENANKLSRQRQFLSSQQALRDRTAIHTHTRRSPNSRRPLLLALVIGAAAAAYYIESNRIRRENFSLGRQRQTLLTVYAQRGSARDAHSAREALPCSRFRLRQQRVLGERGSYRVFYLHVELLG